MEPFRLGILLNEKQTEQLLALCDWLEDMTPHEVISLALNTMSNKAKKVAR